MSLFAIYTGAFLVAFLNYLVNVSIPMFLTRKFFATPFIVGMSGFFGSFAYTLTTLLFSTLKISKTFPSFIPAVISIGILYSLLPFAPSYAFFFLIQFLIGIAYARFWPPLQRTLGSIAPSKVDVFNLTWSGAVILGAFLSGYAFTFNISFPFIMGGLLCMLVFIIFLPFYNIYKSGLLTQKGAVKKEKEKKFKKRLQSIRILNFLTFFSIGTTMFIFPRYGLEINYSPQLIGKILSFLLLARFTTFYIFKRFKIEISKDILLSYIFTSIGLASIGFFKNPVVHSVSMIIIGISNAFSFKESLIYHLYGGYATEIHEGIIGAGFLVGPPVMGTLSKFFGMQRAFIISAFLILITGITVERKKNKY